MRRLIPAALLIAAACGPAITITRDESIPIHSRSTYAWGRADGVPTNTERDPRVDNDSIRARIERAIDAELERKGFRKSSFDDAQLIVHYHVGVQDKVDTIPVEYAGQCNTIPCPAPRYGWGYWGVPESAVREIAYEEGTLMLDFLARPSLKLAWRGLVRAEVTPASADEARIRKGIARVLRDFPGKPQVAKGW